MISEIAGLAAEAVPGEWTSLVYTPRVLTMYAEIELLAQRPDGTIERVPRPDALDAGPTRTAATFSTPTPRSTWATYDPKTENPDETPKSS